MIRAAEMQNWYDMEASEVVSALGSGLEGLSRQEAGRRLAEHGYNELGGEEKTSFWSLVAAQFKSTAERYQQRGDLDEALQYYRKAMEIRLKDSELAAIISDLEKTL